jgi:hypothetical protein
MRIAPTPKLVFCPIIYGNFDRDRRACQSNFAEADHLGLARYMQNNAACRSSHYAAKRNTGACSKTVADLTRGYRRMRSAQRSDIAHAAYNSLDLVSGFKNS